VAADGGLEKLFAGLHDPAIRAKIKVEMASDHPAEWEISFSTRRRQWSDGCGIENPDLKNLWQDHPQIALAQKKSQLDTLF